MAIKATLDNTFGGLLCFVMAGSSFLGVLTIQAITYFCRFPDDPLILRATVLLTWCVWILDSALTFSFFLFILRCSVMEVASQIFGTWTAYYYTVSHFGDYPNLGISHWPVGLVVCFETLLAFVVQVFFARRSWLLNRRQWPISLIALVLAIWSCVAGLIITSITFRSDTFASYSKHKPTVEIMWLGCSAITDILITYSVISSLRGPRTGYKAMDKGIRRLVTYTFSTGAISCVTALFTIVAFYALNGTMVSLGITLILSRVYSNCLLASFSTSEAPGLKIEIILLNLSR
ncbi:hypothetical protein BS47DRAFT_998760 [Hydnum rufescens UP504]|uniref:DUF6534 domain-containing protein n=1 Tax=Hydnum rufescens UP504 TaxID=1448309 RepID=A0A9P6B8Q3_9AGAM|nr:hypothetical protein BS47DRAFT_998760 [Hydnum rufescens UP504]